MIDLISFTPRKQVFVLPGGGGSAGASWDDAFATPADAVTYLNAQSIQGGEIIVGAGTYTQNSGVNLDGPSSGAGGGHHLVGDGSMGSVIINSSRGFEAAGAIIKPGKGSVIANLKIVGTSVTLIQSPIGANVTIGENNFGFASVRKCWTVCDSDGLLVNGFNSIFRLEAEDCLFEAYWDCVRSLWSNDWYMLKRCKLRALGPSTVALVLSQPQVLRPFAVSAGRVDAEDCEVIVDTRAYSSQTPGVYPFYNNAGTLRLKNTAFTMLLQSGLGGTTYRTGYNTGAFQTVLDGVSFNGARVDVPSVGTLAYTQAA